jgi:hypothetical protein
MSSKKEALSNGTALRTVLETAVRAASSRKENVAAVRAVWLGVAKSKPQAKADAIKAMKRSFIIGRLIGDTMGGVISDDTEAMAGAIIDGAEPGRKAKAGQTIRTASDHAAFKRADVAFSEIKKDAGVPTLKPDGTIKKPAVRKPRQTTPTDTTPDPAAKDAGAEKREATPPARTKADYVTGGRAFAATLLAWHNKNAAVAVAPIASAIQDFVKAVNAYKD